MSNNIHTNSPSPQSMSVSPRRVNNPGLEVSPSQATDKDADHGSLLGRILTFDSREDTQPQRTATPYLDGSLRSDTHTKLRGAHSLQHPHATRGDSPQPGINAQQARALSFVSPSSSQETVTAGKTPSSLRSPNRKPPTRKFDTKIEGTTRSRRVNSSALASPIHMASRSRRSMQKSLSNSTTRKRSFPYQKPHSRRSSALLGSGAPSAMRRRPSGSHALQLKRERNSAWDISTISPFTPTSLPMHDQAPDDYMDSVMFTLNYRVRDCKTRQRPSRLNKVFTAARNDEPTPHPVQSNRTPPSIQDIEMGQEATPQATSGFTSFGLDFNRLCSGSSSRNILLPQVDPSGPSFFSTIPSQNLTLQKSLEDELTGLLSNCELREGDSKSTAYGLVECETSGVQEAVGKGRSHLKNSTEAGRYASRVLTPAGVKRVRRSVGRPVSKARLLGDPFSSSLEMSFAQQQIDTDW